MFSVLLLTRWRTMYLGGYYDAGGELKTQLRSRAIQPGTNFTLRLYQGNISVGESQVTIHGLADLCTSVIHANEHMLGCLGSWKGYGVLSSLELAVEILCQVMMQRIKQPT